MPKPRAFSTAATLTDSLQRSRTRAAGALPNTDASPCPQQYNCATFSFPFSIRWLPLDSKISLRNAEKTEIKNLCAESKLVSAHCDEQRCTPRSTGSQRPHRLQPADEPVPLLARALPPAATRCHEHERRQRRIGTRDFRGHVQRLRWCLLYMGDESRFRVCRGSRSRSQSCSELEIWSIGGPAGLRNSTALSRNSPGRASYVRTTTPL